MTLPEEFRRHGYHCISNGKIFHHTEDTGERMLYDLETDAAENDSMAEYAEHQNCVNQLSQMLADGWRRALP